MLRVLMVLEDYGELMFLQTVLKKIGFDVDSTQNTRMVGDALLSLNPEVVVMTAAGKRIRGLDIAGTIKKIRGFPKIILIRSTSLTFDPTSNPAVDGWLDSPVGAPDLLAKIAELAGLDNQSLQDKLLKLRVQDGDDGTEGVRIFKSDPEKPDIFVPPSAPPHTEAQREPGFGILKGSTLTPEARSEKYKKYIEQPKPPHDGFALKDVQEQIKELRRQEEEADLEELERQRRAFVEHLFKKKVG